MGMTASSGVVDAFSSLPEELKSYNQWVVWKLVQKPNKPKPDKIPINPTSHEWASVSDKTTWGSYEHAIATLAAFPSDYAGLGFVVTKEDPFAFIDLDNVRTPEGWNSTVAETLQHVKSWSEFSQSGEGVHVIAKAEGQTAKTQGIELYHYGRFIALTGRKIPDTPNQILRCQEGVDWLRATVLSRGGDEVRPASERPVDRRIESMDRIGAEYVFKPTGKAEMVCPWGHEHGNGDPNGAVYLPAHYNGRAAAAFYCQHATCQGAGRSNLSAFDAWLQQNDPEYRADTLLDAFADVQEADDTTQQENTPPPLFASAQHLLATSQISPKWIFRGLMERGQVGLLYGDSQAYKSYIAIDMAVHMAAGRDWCGHQVCHRAPVMYLAGEGNAGLIGRIDASRQFNRFTKDCLDRLFISSRGIDMMSDADLLLLAEECRKNIGRPPSILIVDTLSRNAILEENSAKDIADLVSRCTTIALQWQCAVLIVHHTGKGKNSEARGSSALTANTDFRFKVVRDDQAGRKITAMTVEKLKSAMEPEHPIVLEANVVSLIGVVDEEGNTPTNLALSQVKSNFKNVSAVEAIKFTQAEAEALSYISEYVADMQSLSPASQETGVLREELWGVYRARKKELGVDIDRGVFDHLIDRLSDKGALKTREADGHVWYLVS